MHNIGHHPVGGCDGVKTMTEIRMGVERSKPLVSSDVGAGTGMMRVLKIHTEMTADCSSWLNLL